MVYRFFYYMANLAIRVYYRRIYINGLENIDKKQAYIMACNHPAGFMEPIIMACTFPRDLYFLVRGDLFEKPVLKNLLYATHQLPIFRFRDGFSSLRQNQDTINQSINALGEKKALMIFAEGSTEYGFGIRPLKKGLARIAFQTLDQYPDLDLKILPIGISFNNVDKVGGDVILNVGKPFDVREFYTSDPQLQPTKLIPLINKTTELMNDLVIQESANLTKDTIRATWKGLSIENQEGFFPRVEKNSNFFAQLQSALKKSESPQQFDHKKYISGKFFPWYLALIPVAMPAYLAMSLPRYIALKLRNTLVKKIEFKSAITFASGTFIALFLIIGINIGSILSIGWAATLALDLSLLFSAYCYLFVWENFKKKALVKTPEALGQLDGKLPN
ncbi:MAG: 1-acyl-sn-glycerol-3-phosphate acyltransferase [Saprospiraceae bacterium]|nr:1-acyl-sn-glycerol-3-phosphate acyltransferase [Saprospiraceae bacterium]